MKPTDEQIRSLRDEALRAADYAMFYLAQIALSEPCSSDTYNHLTPAQARVECARAIDAAAAQAE